MNSSLTFTVTQERDEMHVAFIQKEQSDGPFAVDFHHTACFLENGGDIEIRCSDLVSWVTAMRACRCADKVYNAPPMVALIQVVLFRHAVFSDAELFAQLQSNPRHVCNTHNTLVI